MSLCRTIVATGPRVTRPHRSRAAMVCVVIIFTALAPVAAMNSGEFTAAALEGDGWSATDVRVTLDITSGGKISGQLSAARVLLPGLDTAVHGVTVNCPVLVIDRHSVACENAAATINGLPLDSPHLNADFYFEFESGNTRVSLPAIRIAGGQASAKVSVTRNRWRAELSASGLGMSGLKAAASDWLVLPLPDGVDGNLDGRIELTGSHQLQRAKGTADFYALTGSNAEGSLASENLGASVEFDALYENSAWGATLTLGKTAGQAYVLPVFLDFAMNPMILDGRITMPATGDWLINFDGRQAGVGEFSGVLKLDPEDGSLRQFTLASERAELPGTYDVYLQPFLVGTSADDLETAGSFDVTVSTVGRSLEALTVTLNEAYLDDRKGKFALYGVQGNINWHSRDIAKSVLSWQGGYLYKIGLGKAAFTMSTGGDSIILVEPAVIPVLDGRLKLSRFELTKGDADLPDLEFEADIERIGLRALTRALGWSPFSGTLSGRIPRVRLADNAITVAGAMSAEVFDGSITIDNLRITDPLGVLPQTTADVSIQSLDLAELSSTFSFGHMEGRLDGELKKLRLLGFSPVGFDARLYTSPGDRSRHRISQQAIENISDLGGAGAAAALSRGLLRFFEDFAYDKIGWSCVLEDEVCSMNGIAPAPGNGYYIVKGKGLPRINVIGYRSRVSWPTLVAKLRNINASGPVVRP